MKPQFEARHGEVGEGGIVRDPEAHRLILEDLAEFIAAETPWKLREVTWSSIKGPKGNIEFLFRLVKEGEPMQHDFAALVAEAHRALD